MTDSIDWTDKTPPRLKVAAERAFPGGGMTASGLRREAGRGRLVIERIAGKDYTTMRSIADSRACAAGDRSAKRTPRTSASRTCRAGRKMASFHFQYFIHGKPRKMKLGKVGAVSLEDAKAAAKVAVGNDPALERAARVKKSKTAFGELIPAFLAWKEVEKCSSSYLSELKRSLNNRFKDLHRFHPDDVTRKMISPLLDEIVEENGPVAMTRSRAHLQSFFTWGIQKGYVEHGKAPRKRIYWRVARVDAADSPVGWLEMAGPGEAGVSVRSLGVALRGFPWALFKDGTFF
jgi:hypothetical protein